MPTQYPVMLEQKAAPMDTLPMIYSNYQQTGLLMFRIILLTLLGFVISATSEASSNTVRIVHFSDPHLFEKPENRAVEEPINQQTFRRSIAQGNKLHAQQKINFVVLTGDIGIEQMFLFEFTDKNGAAISIPQGTSDVAGSTIQALLDRRLSVDTLKKSNPDFNQKIGIF